MAVPAHRTQAMGDRHLQTLLSLGAIGQQTDAELLDRFLAASRQANQRDLAELAFKSLVDRHGGTVLRVARTVLGDEAASLDASQATFLILARKAWTLRVGDSLAPWLSTVARRIALGVRRDRARRHRHEQNAARPEAMIDDASISPVWSETLRAVLTEVDRLPEPFRSAVVACHLDGLTQQTAADRLGWPIGTLQSRLDRGRRQLRDRLARRGLAPTSLGLLISADVPLRLPQPLVNTIARAAPLSVRRLGIIPTFDSVFTSTPGPIMLKLTATTLAAVTMLGLAATTTPTGLNPSVQAAGDVVPSPTIVPAAATPQPTRTASGGDAIIDHAEAAKSSRLGDDLIGTWVLAGPPDKPGTPPKSGGRLKFLTGTNWCITEADPQSGKVIFHHGGTYTLDGDELKTTIDYANESTADSIKQTRKFKIKIDKDTYTQVGIDNASNEVWYRIKASRAEPSALAPLSPQVDLAFPIDKIKTSTTTAEPPLTIPTAYPRPWETTVRIKIHLSSEEYGFGSGTIIASTSDESIILTAAHHFKDRRGQYPSAGRFTTPIRVDLFGGSLPKSGPARLKCIETNLEGEVVAIHRDRDFALVRIRPGRVLPAAPIAAGGHVATPGEDLISVGCSHGEDATAWDTKVLQPRVEMTAGSRKFYVVKCSNQPAEGRSGGGLFNRRGYLVGICQFADPNEHTGFYTETLAFEYLNSCINRVGDAVKFDFNRLKSILSPAESDFDFSIRGAEPKSPSPVSDQQRLSDLERKLDRVLESLDNIRGEVGSKRPSGILPP